MTDSILDYAETRVRKWVPILEALDILNDAIGADDDIRKTAWAVQLIGDEHSEYFPCDRMGENHPEKINNRVLMAVAQAPDGARLEDLHVYTARRHGASGSIIDDPVYVGDFIVRALPFASYIRELSEMKPAWKDKLHTALEERWPLAAEELQQLERGRQNLTKPEESEPLRTREKQSYWRVIKALLQESGHYDTLSGQQWKDAETLIQILSNHDESLGNTKAAEIMKGIRSL